MLGLFNHNINNSRYPAVRTTIQLIVHLGGIECRDGF